jgi:hypothetical protein
MRFLPLFAVLLLSLPLRAQGQLTTVAASPHARVQQTVGLTVLSVDYHRPAVNGRTVWGGSLVPYGEVWRAGANQNTVVETSTEIQVEGASLPAGRYGFHLLVGETEATAIFSTMADAWGSYSYTPDEDALRVTVPVLRDRPHQERLLYRFDNPTADAVTLVLHWEAREIPLRLTVDTPSVVLASMERELRGIPGFFWEGWDQIATTALDSGRRLDDALGWSERSIALQATFANRMTQAALLDALGRAAEATALRDEAFADAAPEEVRDYARARRRAGKPADADAALARLGPD